MLLEQEVSLLAVHNPDLGVRNLGVKEARKRCHKAEASTDYSLSRLVASTFDSIPQN